MRVPGWRNEGFPKAQVLGLGRDGQASCYGERNIMQLTCLTGGLEKYPRPSGLQSHPSFGKVPFMMRVIYVANKTALTIPSHADSLSLFTHFMEPSSVYKASEASFYSASMTGI